MPYTKKSYSDDRIREVLEAHFCKEVRNIQPLKGGSWSSAYSFQSEKGDFVVRFAKGRDAFEKDRVAAGFASTYLPIPRVLVIGEESGGHFAISERAFGEMLDDLSKDKMRRIIPAVFRMLDAARAVDLSSTEGFGDWAPPGRAPYKTWCDCLLDAENDPPGHWFHGWRAAMEDSPIGDAAFNEVVERWKQWVREPPDGRHLIHNDLLYRNVLVSGDRISAVLDWQSSLYGDFLYDLALLAYGALWFPAMEGIDWEEEARRHFASIGLDVPNLEERLHCCKIHVGLGALQWSVFTRQWDEMEWHAKRTLALARE